MATPSYSNLITQIVKRLREDARLNSVDDSSIVEGDNLPRVVNWPAVTVALDQVEEQWRTFAGRRGGNKKAICTVRLSVLSRTATGTDGYSEGLKTVEDLVQTIDDVIQSDMTISGVAYRSENSTKTFAQGQYDNTPVISADIALITELGFGRAY